MDDLAEKARQLTGTDLHAYIEAKGITYLCTACGDDQVAIISHGPDEPLHILAMPRTHPSNVAGEALEMVGIACQNCGYIRLFGTLHIVEWKEQEPADVE